MHASSYILSMQSTKDVKEYLEELLGANRPEVEKFKKEFMFRWQPPQRKPSPPSVQGDELVERLVRPQKEEMVLFCGEGVAAERGGGKFKGPKKVRLLLLLGAWALFTSYNQSVGVE